LHRNARRHLNDVIHPAGDFELVANLHATQLRDYQKAAVGIVTKIQSVAPAKLLFAQSRRGR
jgi:hypothetical protein